MLLWLSFKLWVWHKELHILYSLHYLFIVLYAVLFHDLKLFPCGIIVVEVWNSSYVVLIVKMCIYIESGLDSTTGYWRKDTRGIEVTGRQGRRRRKLLDDLKERRGYSHLKEEALDCTMWLARFGRGFGCVVRRLLNKWMTVYTVGGKSVWY
jgi:hypothetical protein